MTSRLVLIINNVLNSKYFFSFEMFPAIFCGFSYTVAPFHGVKLMIDQWSTLTVNCVDNLDRFTASFLFCLTSLDFNYVKPSWDLIKLKLQLLTLWLGVLMI